jgi:hypothetical protein
MIVALGNGLYLSTDISEASRKFAAGKFRVASVNECASALHLQPVRDANDSQFLALAFAIANQKAYVGILLLS